MKLYPPYIEGTIPAFYGNYLKVPFQMNKAVGQREVIGISLKIKTVQSNTYLATCNAYYIQKPDINTTSYVSFEPDCFALFDLSDYMGKKIFYEGQFYKIQIAYISAQNGDIGYYSTVGITKYTTRPVVTIETLVDNEINAHNYLYVGNYSQLNKDTTEKVYSYKFDLRNEDGELLDTSDYLIHNSSEDTEPYESIDQHEFPQELELNKRYYLTYTVKTINGLEITSPRYRIMRKKSINAEIDAEIIPELNYENGYVNVILQGHANENGAIDVATGSFRIVRSSNEDQYQVWDEILRFTLYGQELKRWLWRDYTVKQGVTYKYALQQYNDYGLLSNKIESKPIYIDFEDAFLYDGKYQLKIKYNPKINSFKNVILENKTDTIGNKYPFIYRNRNVNYKEFPVSGLISYLMDEEFLFINPERNKQIEPTLNLAGENIAAEREFKLDVLNWLTNGEPKLFRSPSEGNYIIRLLNVSLSPNDIVGRMLHTFNATAYEVADYNYQNLSEYGFVNTEAPDTKQLREETIIFKDYFQNNDDYGDNILAHSPAVALKFEGMIPGDKIHLVLMDGSQKDIVVGVTGSYIIDLQQGAEVKFVGLYSSLDNAQSVNKIVTHQGQLTYSYYSTIINKFNTITDIDIKDIVLKQYIGPCEIVSSIEDIKNTILQFNFLHAMIMEVMPIYRSSDGKFWFNKVFTNPVNKFENYILYKVNENGREYYYNHNTGENYELSSYDPKIYINNNPINLEDIIEYDIREPKGIKSLRVGLGVLAEVSMQIQVVNYELELYEPTKNFKQEYELCLEEYLGWIRYNEIMDYDEWVQVRMSKLPECKLKIKNAYDNYIKTLIQAIKEWEAAQGV